MTASEAGSALAIEGAIQRRSREREPILSRARAMRRQLGMPSAPALAPILILTGRDRLN
jgi:hypothetical protein